MKTKIRFLGVLTLCLIVFGIVYFCNRICHPRKDLINVNKFTSYTSIIWQYGMPDVSTGFFYIEPIATPRKVVLYRIDKNTSYQLLFCNNELYALNVVRNGIISSKILKEN